MKKNILYFIFFFVVILFFTHGLFANFFQQDEWGAFGDLMYSYNLPWWNFLVSRGVHFTPFGLLFWLLLYKLFGLNAQYYVFIELLMHALASFLVFIFISKFSKNNKVGFLTALLFATNGRAYEAFMHLAIFSTTVSSFIFIILFFIYLGNIKNKYFTKTNVFILFCIFLASVFFREDGFMIIPLFGIYLFAFDRQKLNRKNLKAFIWLFIGLVLFIILRSVSQSLNTTPIPISARPAEGSIVYNLVTLPMKFVVQNLISATSIFRFLIGRTEWAYPTLNVSFLQGYAIFMDMVFIVFFNFLIWIFSLWMRIWKNKNKVSYVIFFSLWILLNAAFLSLVGRNLHMVEERYLYLSSVPVLFFTSFFVIYLFTSKDKYKILSVVKKITAVTIVTLLLYTSYIDIQEAVKFKVANANARRTFLNSVLQVHPTIPNNTIFYIQCKVKCYRNSEFGLSPDWVLPFTSGPGWNILVKYSVGNEKNWGKFLNNDFLLNLNSQGYRKIGDRSFGYYIDSALLKKTLREKGLDKNMVIALEYDEKDFTVRDISKAFRKSLDEK